MTEWTRKPLSEVADFCLGKMLDQKKNKGDLLPYLANINVRWGGFDLCELREMRFEQHEMERYCIKNGDIVMCEGGEPGRCAIWKEQLPRMMIQKALHRIRPHSCLNNIFLYYYFLYEGKNGSFSRLFTGSTIKHLPRQSLAKFEVAFPALDIQQRIASTLSSYDDLIENNRRRIQLLEESARMLYKEWFVRLRFPGHEHVKVVDGVPEGWERKKFSAVCSTIGGGTPKTQIAEYWNGDITWVVPTDVTRNDSIFLLESERKITEKGLKESSAKIVPPYTILMTSRASVGFFAMMDHEVCTNQGFINIIPYSFEYRMYFLFNLISRADEIRKNAKGTTYPEISKKVFASMDIIVPQESLIAKFCVFASNVFEQICCLKKQNAKLALARDLLLPKLMNGEVAV